MKWERKVVAIGGGTGLSTLLRGLKHYPLDITALVTVADDGGSSGRLREEFNMLPPGDIRNVIVSLSKSETLMDRIMQYRFEGGEGLDGHSLGNLMLTAATKLCNGSFVDAIGVMSQLLNAEGKVYPATERTITLCAEFEDGTIVRGESNIPKVRKKIERLYLEEEDVRPVPEAIRAIEDADVIVLGPGSLYTSIIPNVLIDEIREAISQSVAPVVYICNVMTQPGETTSYTANDHLEALERYLGPDVVDTIIVNNESIDASYLKSYREDDADIVTYDEEAFLRAGIEVLADDIVDYNHHFIRHDSDAVASLVMRKVLSIRRMRHMEGKEETL
ncbi:gluconeogenesis factor YvcK family protein [Exiguobacterium flavidum]|uniref:gluconeogenesis factor YvcK family protein n=1 Tax=Exiguobacterium flavidum TaxID=2184695 RepID=UPI000DF7AA46|nr:YvcK family protein [Exiguobacterium flavidum]